MAQKRYVNPLSRREVLKFGAYTTVGGVLTPGISRAQAILTDTKGITARDIQINVGGTMIPAYDAHPEAVGRYPIIDHSRPVPRRHQGGRGLRQAAAVGPCRQAGRNRLLRRRGDGDALRHRVPGSDGGGAVVRPPRAQVQGLHGGCV